MLVCVREEEEIVYFLNQLLTMRDSNPHEDADFCHSFGYLTSERGQFNQDSATIESESDQSWWVVSVTIN